MIEDLAVKAGSTVKVPSLKVLVADDNMDAADTLAALLDMDGFDVRTVYSGVAAVDAAKAAMPDIVVMDIGMPLMDGYEAACLIRGQPDGQKAVLIALTGWGESADKGRALEAGFNHHLVKPVDYDSLVRCLRQS